jgi:hypothetical protein
MRLALFLVPLALRTGCAPYADSSSVSTAPSTSIAEKVMSATATGNGDARNPGKPTSPSPTRAETTNVRYIENTERRRLSSPEDNVVNHRSGIVPKQQTMNAKPELVMWPCPRPLPSAVNEMWRLYKEFEFQRVIESAMEFAALDAPQAYPLATAYMLAAASAYLVAEPVLARRFAELSMAAEPRVCPDPKTFPDAFCRLFDSANRNYSNETTTSSDSTHDGDA